MVASSDIAAEARQVKFSRIALILALGFPWLLGWAAGHLWLGLVVCAISVRRGWRDATGYVPPPPPAR